MRRNTFYIVLASTLLSACATVPQQSQRYVFPPEPDEARLEWKGSYASQYDFPQTSFDVWRRKLAGKEPAKTFGKPWGIATDGAGKVYVSDTQAAMVLVYDFTSRKIDAIGSGTLKTPMGVALDAKGNVYVSDSVQNRVFIFDKAGKAQGGMGSDESLNWPVGIAVDDSRSRIYVVSAKTHNISVFSLAGKYLFSIGKSGGGDGEFNYPTDVDIDSKGNIVVADSMNSRVQILDPDGKFIKKFGQRGDGPADFEMIKGIAVDRITDNVYVTDGKADKVVVFSPQGEPLMSFGKSHSVQFSEGAGGLYIPQAIDIDANGRIYVVDSMNRRFQVFQIVYAEWVVEAKKAKELILKAQK